MDIVLSKDRKIILLDTSYYVFHRYYATLKWYSFKWKATNETDLDYASIHENMEFVDAFKKHVLADIGKWTKLWKTTRSNLVLCLDCPHNEVWRNDLHDSYKGTRVQNATFNPNIFPIFYNYANELNLQKIGVPCLEADDVVALVSGKLKELNNDVSIVIYTNDNDYLQLRCDNIVIHNMMSPKNDASNLAKRSAGSPEIDLCIKTLMGDVSDNISPVCAKIGAKTSLKVATMSEEEREKWLISKGPECVAAYQLNKTLVSFANIPPHLSSVLFERYNIKLA
jgi:5'-3' exonuclease